MKNIIYTYYDEALPDQQQLIDIFKNSWSKKGWEPEVVSRADIKLTPEIEKQIAIFESFPTVNGIKYELACYLRWIFMSQNGGWMADYDVLNLSLDAESASNVQSLSVCHDGVPCLVFGSTEDYTKLVDLLANGQRFFSEVNGKPHTSDMFIIRGLIAERNPLIKKHNFTSDFPTYNKTVHCSFCHTNKAGLTKLQAMNFYE